MSDSKCQECGVRFHPDQTKRNWKHIKFCSDKCRKAVAARKKRESYKSSLIEDKACLFCKKTFTPSPTTGSRQKYCDRVCYLEHKKHLKFEEWAGQRTTKECENCGIEFFPNKFSPTKQVYCSHKCQVSAIHKRHYGKYNRGAPYQKEFKMVRPFVLERDKVCTICGSDDRLHVHHLDNSGNTEDCDNSMDNLTTLCHDCHSAIHRITLIKVGGEWRLDGKIFERIGLTGDLTIKT